MYYSGANLVERKTRVGTPVKDAKDLAQGLVETLSFGYGYGASPGGGASPGADLSSSEDDELVVLSASDE